MDFTSYFRRNRKWVITLLALAAVFTVPCLAEAAEKAGYEFRFGAEMEFYLFKLDDYGDNVKVPYDNAGYMDIAPYDKSENIRREICISLKDMGIYPESSHHEEGPGQNEIDFRYSDPLSAADNALTFRKIVQDIALHNGLWASFSPKTG